MKRNWSVWFTMWSTTRSTPAWQRIPAPGIGRARGGWQAKAPAPRLARTLAKCRNSRDRPPGLSLFLTTSLPAQNHLPRIPRRHRLEALLILRIVEAVRDHRADIQSRLQHHAHLVPGLVHLAAVDAL